MKNMAWEHVGRKKVVSFLDVALFQFFFFKRKFMSLIMGPDSPFLSRDQNIYLYGNWRKNTSSMKTKTPLPEVTDPFQ